MSAANPRPADAQDRTGARHTGATYAAGPINHTKAATFVPYAAHLAVAGLGTWDYTGALPLKVRAGKWEVEWGPAVVEPDLAGGERLGHDRSVASRGQI